MAEEYLYTIKSNCEAKIFINVGKNVEIQEYLDGNRFRWPEMIMKQIFDLKKEDFFHAIESIDHHKPHVEVFEGKFFCDVFHQIPNEFQETMEIKFNTRYEEINYIAKQLKKKQLEYKNKKWKIECRQPNQPIGELSPFDIAHFWGRCGEMTALCWDDVYAIIEE